MNTKFKKEWTDAELRKVIRKFSLWAPSHLQITHGDKERTISDTYGLPYTSSGECAGVWNTNVEAVLKDDPIIELIKPRFLTPSGINCFDTPLFTYWFSQSIEKKKQSVDKWLHEFDCIRIPVYTILYLWRLCANFSDRVAKSGFMQESADTCDLINIQYDENVAGYPVVSGFQSRVNIRFLPFDKESKVGDVPFKIAYIKSSLQQ